MTPGGFPHSDILGSQVGCHLPEAFRRLPRPSSAPLAKAFTVCPLRLGNTKTLKLLTRCSRPLCSSQETTPHPHHQRNRADHAGEDQPHTPHQPEDQCQDCVQPHNSIACLHLKPTMTTARSRPTRGRTRAGHRRRSASSLMFHP